MLIGFRSSSTTSGTSASPPPLSKRGVSVATVVREAIDRGLPEPQQRRRTAARHLLDAPDMAVPDVAELRTELEALRSRRA